MDNWRFKRLRDGKEIRNKPTEQLEDKKKAEEKQTSSKQSNALPPSLKVPKVHSSWQPSSFPTIDKPPPSHKRPCHSWDSTSNIKQKTTERSLPGEKLSLWGVQCCGNWNFK